VKNLIGDWEKAKTILDEMEFPNEVGRKSDSGEYHKTGRTIHSLETYRLYFKPIEGYRVEGKYNYCPECRATRNQYLVMFNNKERKVYRKDFIKHGKIV